MLARKTLIKDKRSGLSSNLDRPVQEENKKAKTHRWTKDGLYTLLEN